MPPEEQKLWHSHAYEVKSGLWVNPRVPELIGKPELENLAKTYGKFWCTWGQASYGCTCADDVSTSSKSWFGEGRAGA
ncbi:oil body-associated protein 2A isoform X2 [Vigna angularis]|nr:oil body-associated protein 2A isoform X2 [Vigna angularis]